MGAKQYHKYRQPKEDTIWEYFGKEILEMFRSMGTLFLAVFFIVYMIVSLIVGMGVVGRYLLREFIKLFWQIVF